MFCLKVLEIYVLALPVSNTNPLPAYNATVSIIPLINKACLSLSSKRQNLSKHDLNNYACLCLETGIGTKVFIQDTYNVINVLKKKNHPSLKRFAETFSNISKYLQTAFSRQDQIIKLLDGEIDTIPQNEDCQISDFILENLLVPLDQLHSKYSSFLMNHILEKYKKDFEKLNIFNIPRMLKNEFGFIDCHNVRSHQQGDFKSMTDIIKTINGRTMKVVDLMIKSVS